MTRIRGGSGTAPRMVRVAWMPSTAGIRTSIITTSGRRRRTSGSTSAPSPASPTTVKPGSASMMARRPVRISTSSSTIRTSVTGPSHLRTLNAVVSLRFARPRHDRDGDEDPPAPVVRAGAHPAPEDRDTLADAAQPAPAARVGRDRPGDRVDQLEFEPGAGDRQAYGHAHLAGVPERVGQALLHDPVRLPRHDRRDLLDPADLRVDLDPGRPGLAEQSVQVGERTLRGLGARVLAQQAEHVVEVLQRGTPGLLDRG